ncbi:MAG TPA: transposase [Chloroflexia bacterium]|jgi:REP element-mobilizing transposase RayT
MSYDPDRHHRHSTRLKGYDYAQAGAYFITIVTQGRESFLGQVLDGEVKLHMAGDLVAQQWYELPNRFPNIETDEFVVMPNHIHGIIVIHSSSVNSYSSEPGTNAVAISKVETSVTLGNVVRAFKAVTTQLIRKSGLVEFGWQRNYHDHIIRNEHEMDNIRAYILYNPANWAQDEENL